MNTKSSAEETRQRILTIAAEEIHLHGFQSCNISAIIKKAAISKGALYHHFDNKQALGYAVVDEVFSPQMLTQWDSVFNSDEPVAAMIVLFRDTLISTDCACLSRGCPMNNLAQEMSPVDEGFRLRISNAMGRWQDGLEKSLMRGQGNGRVNPDVDAKQTAIFLIASIEGAYGLAKNAQNIDVLSACIDGLINFLETVVGSSYECKT